MRILIILLLLSSAAWAQFAIEFEVADIEVGISSEAQAVKKLGPGYVVHRPDGGRTRIYTDGGRTKTMYVSCSANGLVEEVQVVRGLTRGYAASMRCLLPGDKWVTRNRIGLGATRRKLINAYGDPTQEADIGGLHWLNYKTDYSKDRRVRLMYQASFGFRGDTVERILIHNGH